MATKGFEPFNSACLVAQQLSNSSQARLLSQFAANSGRVRPYAQVHQAIGSHR